MSPPPTRSRSQFVICLAGHIDHGKSCLVHALTGGTVDRLPEEKRRGITIDVGFSHFEEEDARFVLIDVPGHERLVHTMVAGASGVDVALLVIAADDSVMPQTREHLALLELLGVRRGVIAITKCDLADEEQLELAELEIEELVAPTFLAQAPRIRVSAQSGLGIDRLRQSLIAAARVSETRSASDIRFRLPIDRAFSPKGQGAVVTGTVWRGVTRVGDTLHLLPSATPVRIRRLQAQGKDVEEVSAGQRAAINLVGVKAADIRRGDELASPHAFEPAYRHLVQLRLLPDAPHAIRHRQVVRVHLGAKQAPAQVQLANREISPGEIAPAILRTKSPIVAEYGQPFVIRQMSPATTIGGGVILSPALRAEDRLRHCLLVAEGLANADPHVRLAAFLDLRGEESIDDAIESWIGVNPQECQQVAAELVKQRKIVCVPAARPRFLTATGFENLKQALLRRCKIELERRKPASHVPVSAVLAGLRHQASTEVLEALLQDLVARREILQNGDRIGLPSGANLSQRQRQMLDQLLAECVEAGPAPPTIKEFSQKHDYSLKDLEPLIQVAVDEALLLRLTPEILIAPAEMEKLRVVLAEHFQNNPAVKVGEIRQLWGITRKHAVPILEYFDRCQITSRADDLRKPGPRCQMPLEETTG